MGENRQDSGLNVFINYD